MGETIVEKNQETVTNSTDNLETIEKTNLVETNQTNGNHNLFHIGKNTFKSDLILKKR